MLFQSRLLGPLLRAMGAVPVRRRQDHPEGPLDNDAAFERLFAVLGAGRAVGIFPEGISHNRPQLQALKTGAARIALGAQQRYPGRPIAIVPTGLVYIRPHRFRSRVLVQFGEPIALEQGWRQAYERDAREAVRALTTQIEQRLRALTIHAEDWETVRVLDAVGRLYQPAGISLEQRVELARRFHAAYPQVRDEPKVRALYARVRDYLGRLEELGLSDAALRHGVGAREAAARALEHALLLLMWLPLAALGAVVHLPVGLGLAALAESLAPRKDVVGTTKFMGGLLALVSGWTALAALAGWCWGWSWALAALAALPLSGYATLRVLGRAQALRHFGRTSWRLLRLRRQLEALRRERAALQQAVLRAVERYRPPGLQPLFPERTAEADAQAWTL
ncbi:MAG: hypothetical protein KatS3mg102_0472 [Planctomycetota bacterium]|nr:MAG: hypothetical protein KatS3mg102_0472 [Planctomycetota bacterium]